MHRSHSRWGRARRILSVLAAVVLIAAMALPAGAFAAAPRASAPAGAVTYDLTGTLFDADDFMPAFDVDPATGTPIPGVKVVAFDETGEIEQGSAYTDADGKWTIPLPDGTYIVKYDPSRENRTSSKDWVRGFYCGNDAPSAALDQVSAAPIMIDGAPVDIASALEHGVVINGRVSAAGGWLSSLVTVYDAGQTAFESMETVGLYADYYFVVPADGSSYYIGADPNYAGQTWFLARYYADNPAHGVRVFDDATGLLADTPGAVHASITVDCAIGGAVRGTVLKPGGAPAAGVGVEISMLDENGSMTEMLAAPFTDATGVFEVKPVEICTVGVAVDPNALAAWDDPTSSFNATNATNYVRMDAGGQPLSAPTPYLMSTYFTRTLPAVTLGLGSGMSGRLTNTGGTPLTNMRVLAFGEGSDFVTATVTNGSGDYALAGMPVDTYHVKADPAPYNEVNDTDYLLTYYESNPVTLPPVGGVLTGVDIVLQNGCRISGAVHNPSGAPIEGVAATVILADGNDFTNVAYSAASGAYVARGVPYGYGGGRMKVYFDTMDHNDANPGANLVPEYWSDKATFRTADIVSLALGATGPVYRAHQSSIDATIVNGASISGKVSPPPGCTTENIYVQLYDAAGESVDSTYTDAVGDYRFEGVAPGTYRISAAQDYYDGVTDVQYFIPERFYNSDTGTLAGATPIGVGADEERVGVNFPLKFGSRVTGVVTDNYGDPVDGVAVVLRDATGNQQRAALTDADGIWEIPAAEGVGPGTYRVQFDPSGSNDTYGTNYPVAYYKTATASSPNAAGATQLTLTFGGNRTGIHGKLTANAGKTITGTLKDGTGANPVPAGGQWNAQAWELIGSQWRSVALGAVTASGTFSISGLQPTVDYRISVEDEDRDGLWGVYAPQFYRSGAATTPVSWATQATKVTAPSAITFNVRRSGLVVVKTTDENADPLENVDVYMEWKKPDGTWWPVDGGAMGYTMAGGELDIAWEGAYDVALMPGTYRFRFDRYGYDTVWYDSAASATTATPVSVTEFDKVAWAGDTWVEQQMFPTAFSSGQIAGADRFAVAYDLAKLAYGNLKGTTSVIIASGLDAAAPDPLSAGGLAGVYRAPILLVRGDRPSTLPKPTSDALTAIQKANPGKKITVFIVGGPGSVPDTIKTPITKALGGATRVAGFTRFTGRNRFAVAEAVAAHVRGKTGAAKCFVVNGTGPEFYWDALAASPIAYTQHFPILLSRADTVTPTTLAEAKKYGERIVIGDETHVGASVRAALDAGRISGTTRADVAANVAASAWDRGWIGLARVAIGNKLPDSLAGGSAIGALNGVLLYTGDGANTATGATFDPLTYQFLVNYRDRITKVHLLGGNASVEASTVMPTVEEALTTAQP